MKRQARNFDYDSARLILAGFLIVVSATCMAQDAERNPWLPSGGLAVDRDAPAAEKNSWRKENKAGSENQFDESKYPPLDENEVLGMGEFDTFEKDPEVTEPVVSAPGKLFHYPQSQDYEQMPVYPGATQANGAQQYPYPSRQYGSAPYPQRSYQPAYQGNNRSNNFFPGGFPFSGNNNSGMPFGMGNNWMPFSENGFW